MVDIRRFKIKRLTLTPNERTLVTYPYVWWDDVFTKEDCEKIISYCDEQQLERAKIFSEEQDDTNCDKDVRISMIKFIYPNDDTQWIFDKFLSVTDMINNQFYEFELDGFEYFQYTTYSDSEQGKYSTHIDMRLGRQMDDKIPLTRKLSLTLSLTDPSTYEGGDLIVYTGSENEKLIAEQKQGRVIAFPSWVMHSVEPVTSGIRKSAVVWALGPKFR